MESRKRCVVAVGIRPTRTFVMVTDLLGKQPQRRFGWLRSTRLILTSFHLSA
jgi:hypothetical protein